MKPYGSKRHRQYDSSPHMDVAGRSFEKIVSEALIKEQTADEIHPAEIRLIDCDAGTCDCVERCKCGKPAVWHYDPAPGDDYYCADCVNRGCSCQIDPDGTEYFDTDGRQLPCCEYTYREEGYPKE